MNFKDGLMEIRPTTEADIESLKDHLFDVDVEDLRELYGLDPKQGLERACSMSASCSTVLYGGVPMAIYGVVPIESSTSGNSWMMTSKQIDRMKIAFLRKSKLVWDDILASYPVAFSYVNTKSQWMVRWLEWCGGVLEGTVPGEKGRTFVLFSMKRSSHV